MDVTAVLLAAGAASTPGFFDAGAGRFLVSPGFGGLAALVGVLVAYVGVRRQSTDTRAKITADRAASDTRAAAEDEATRQDRWWTTLTWVYDRATAERDEARLPASIALEMFDRLSEIAEGVLELQVIDGLHDLFPDRTGDDDGHQAGPATTGESE